MPQSTASCPRCKTPVMVEIQQLFDVNTDPGAKQKLLSGLINVLRCPNCGYQGNLSTPMVYHDPAKELLLTYFPPELGIPVNEQERMIGPLIKQVDSKLSNEQRKAYLLRPQTMLTYDTLIERVLAADGVTKEMLQAQQQRLSLLQRLMGSSPESRATIIETEQILFDQSFFVLLSRLAEASLSSGDQQTAQQLASVQKDLFEKTEFGRELHIRSTETQEAIKSLQQASEKGLTREGLLELMIAAPTEIRLQTLVSMTRSGMDYAFFQLLTGRIDTMEGTERRKLIDLRDKLLKMTQEIDQAVQAKTAETLKLLEEILASPKIEEALEKRLEQVDEFFVELVKAELNTARKKADLDRVNKLEQVIIALQKYTAPPPEIALIQELVSAENEDSRNKILAEHADQITPEFLQAFATLVAQSETQKQPAEVIEEFKTAYRAVVKFSMQKNLK